jgi:hypothetical protein
VFTDAHARLLKSLGKIARLQQELARTVTDRRATTFQGSGDRRANLEALGAAAGRRPPR